MNCSERTVNGYISGGANVGNLGMGEKKYHERPNFNTGLCA